MISCISTCMYYAVKTFAVIWSFIGRHKSLYVNIVSSKFHFSLNNFQSGWSNSRFELLWMQDTCTCMWYFFTFTALMNDVLEKVSWHGVGRKLWAFSFSSLPKLAPMVALKHCFQNANKTCYIIPMNSLRLVLLEAQNRGSFMTLSKGILTAENDIHPNALTIN